MLITQGGGENVKIEKKYCKEMNSSKIAFSRRKAAFKLSCKNFAIENREWYAGKWSGFKLSGDPQ